MKGAERMQVRPPKRPDHESRIWNAAERRVTLLVEAGRQADDARLVAVVDADLDRLLGEVEERPNLIRTDAHDLETTLLSGPALERVLLQVAREALLHSEEQWGEPLRGRLFRWAEGLGRLRWLKIRLHPELDALRFKGKEGEPSLRRKYADCVESGWTPSVERSIRAVCLACNAHHLLPPRRNLAGEARALGEADLLQLCNGHDLLGLLAAWLMEEGGRHAPDAGELAELLAVACPADWLARTAMWDGLRRWERENPGSSLLR